MLDLTSTPCLVQGGKHIEWESLPGYFAIYEGLDWYDRFWCKSKDIAKCLQTVTQQTALLPAIA
jgi:hypothetical protein